MNRLLVMILSVFSVFFLLSLNACKEKTEQPLVVTSQQKQQLESDELKKKELDLKEKELDLKEKELQQQKEKSLQPQQQPIEKPESNTEYYRSGYGRFPQGSERYLNSSDLNNLSVWELKIMRNEIFARHGYIFQTQEMRDYFLKQNWYDPKYYDVNNMLSKVEKDNIDLIKRFEK